MEKSYFWRAITFFASASIVFIFVIISMLDSGFINIDNGDYGSIAILGISCILVLFALAIYIYKNKRQVIDAFDN
ncbi:hypothetical protein ACFQNF_11690 [Iodobacter arcticus]|uniref:Uncharacterized protein n=1 Tax=Iodobacter arcticus TaxID=590593 RepID=A0ABW2QYK2_9NEIS